MAGRGRAGMLGPTQDRDMNSKGNRKPDRLAAESHNCRCRVTAIGASAIRESAFQPSAAGSRFPQLMAEQPEPDFPTPVAVTCHLKRIQLGQHVVLSLPMSGGSGWRLAVGGWEVISGLRSRLQVRVLVQVRVQARDLYLLLKT